jgi:hypothetical protein
MDLYEAVEMKNQLPMKYFFIGDEAFTNTNQFLSPWPGKCFAPVMFYFTSCCEVLTISIFYSLF